MNQIYFYTYFSKKGIVALSSSTRFFFNCKVSNNLINGVSQKYDSYSGGFIADSSKSIFYSCTTTGNVISSESLLKSYSGGLIAYSDSPTNYTDCNSFQNLLRSISKKSNPYSSSFIAYASISFFVTSSADNNQIYSENINKTKISYAGVFVGYSGSSLLYLSGASSTFNKFSF